MKSLVIILIGIYLSWLYTDLSSEQLLPGVLAPLGLTVFIISLLLWLVLNTTVGHSTGDSGFFSGGDGGGDGGGGD